MDVRKLEPGGADPDAPFFEPFDREAALTHIPYPSMHSLCVSNLRNCQEPLVEVHLARVRD